MDPEPARLIITADDWGYSPRYNAGILAAVRAGGVDAVGAMVLRAACDPQPLLESGVEVGVHLETAAEPGRQVLEFEHRFGQPPAFLDGHHHCHAEEPLAAAVEELALQLDVAVRPVGDEHRNRLRSRGIATADATIGRMSESEPALPAELVAARRDGALPTGTTEWIVHPGYRDPGAGSRYDRGREQDLELLLELAGDPSLSEARGIHREVLFSPRHAPNSGIDRAARD
jgi:predicted glycoside hydrolase/deacetylase ChbG (UPF0249 family)